MSDYYNDADLGRRMAGIGPVDRFVRTVERTLEHVVSLSIQTEAGGWTHRQVSVDLVGPDGSLVLSVILGTYRMGSGVAALQDADQVATTLGLVLRLSDPHGGWKVAADPDALRSATTTGVGGERA